ncbi:MAG: hypothetical protein Q4P08_02600 [Eubacteriales bacterium]|nr:hypothetical protein [Eubacteriales bacterium]
MSEEVEKKINKTQIGDGPQKAAASGAKAKSERETKFAPNRQGKKRNRKKTQKQDNQAKPKAEKGNFKPENKQQKRRNKFKAKPANNEQKNERGDSKKKNLSQGAKPENKAGEKQQEQVKKSPNQSFKAKNDSAQKSQAKAGSSKNNFQSENRKNKRSDGQERKSKRLLSFTAENMSLAEMEAANQALEAEIIEAIDDINTYPEKADFGL